MGDQIPGAEKKIVAALLAILIGGLGIHKFYLGYNKAGAIQIVITFLTCGMAGIIALIEGIIYLTKSDEEFVELYVNGQKEWF
jgi:TM2 domain-containing membrane protein YozV